MVDSFTIDLNDLPEGSVFGLAVAGTETDSGDSTTGPAIDVSSLLGNSITEEVVDSFTIDLNDLPEGSVFGLAVAVTETDSGDSTTGPAIDVSSLLGNSITEEVVDSFTIDLNDLPEGSVFALAVAGTETASGDSTTVPAIDVSSCSVIRLQKKWSIASPLTSTIFLKAASLSSRCCHGNGFG